MVFLELTWMSFIMIILASYRLIHLIVFDKITEFIRKPFLKENKTQSNNRRKEPKSTVGYC